MFNEDWMHFFWARYSSKIDVTEEVLRAFIYQYKDTDITDFAMNVNGTIATFNSRVLQNFSDKYLLSEENGRKVDYKSTCIRTAYEIFTEKGLDMYQIWIDALREINVTPWVSIRMNDCHGNMKPNDVKKSSFVEEHPDLWRAYYREATNYFDKCLNYLLPEVRQRMLDFVDEVLERYDCDGIELDFTRELWCFPTGLEAQGAPVMTQLLEHIRQKTRAYEKKRGHSIKLAVLLASTPLVNMHAGLDIADWMQRELVDVIVACPRWITIDYTIPTEAWKLLIGDKPIRFGVCQQLMMRPYPDAPATESSVDMAFGQAAVNLSRGADFVYLYNYMDLDTADMTATAHPDGVRRQENQKHLFGNIGTIEALNKVNRSHILTFCDYYDPWERAHARLPLHLGNNTCECIRISTGCIPKNATVTLVLGVKSDEKIDKSAFTVYVNTHLAAPDGTYVFPAAICPYTQYAFRLDGSTADGYAAIELYCKRPCTVEFAAIEVEPAKLPQ